MSYGRPPFYTVCISRQRNSGYRPSKVNIMAQGLSTPDPFLSPKHLYKESSRNNYTLHTPSGKPDGVAEHYTSPFPGVAD